MEKREDKTWERKARDVYQEGVKIFREGLKGLETVAEKTLEVGGLKLITQQSANRLERIYQELGHEIYTLVTEDRKTPIPVSQDILLLVDQILELKKLLSENRERLLHASVTSTKRSAKKRGPKKGTTKKLT